MLEAALSALSQLSAPETLLALVAGVVTGLVVGVLPGLGGTAGLALLLPFVFGMEPNTALAMMIGLTAVTTTSDTFPSVLMGIPGTSGSQATVLDGFPMSKRGEGTRALSAAFISSLFGGIFGAFVLSFAVFFAKPIILKIGFGEQFMLVVLALSMVGILTGSNIWKGLGACSLGLMLGALGAAPLSGVERATLGTEYLLDPLPLVIVGLAMFATPEIIDLLRRQSTISETGKLGAGWLQGFKDWLANWWLSLRCSFIGCIIGALPGLGGSVVDWIAYGHALQTTKNRESYGTGDVRGVIAPESANNAKEGGALIPTILLGIPGSGSMAILLGGLILIGVEPGTELVTDQLDQVYLIIWSIAAANIVGAGICFALSPQIAKLTTIRYVLLAPFMFGIIFFAAFQATRSWGDLVALFLLSTLGVYMKRFGWSRPALLIGFVLSARVEKSVYQTVALYGASFLERPIVMVLLVLTVLSIAAAVFFKQKPPGPMSKEGPFSNQGTKPQWIFLALLVGGALFILQDGMNFNQLTGLFPMVASISALLFFAPLAAAMLLKKAPSGVFFDAERVADKSKPSAEFFLGLLAGMLLLAALVGFVLGIATFIFLFLWLRANVAWWKALLGAGGFVLFLGVLSNQLTLQYPTGLLQSWITLPWPLQ
ncbi:MAG: tripartite tricarboxylate transporter permease [Roseibium sp.]|uniref:tripartite tricarboxylate transporter permease n=1 Tax=Roseibium sp. TaxID=1936156 RepID=UPI001B129372|nr:tripartite tricarboxylate transporter permease [Roseibium sp.]MBO6892622.1 tripartite tricarboxylate transporter permease [Roseibium sp.]MBO6928248.1 tripartite tricarboxylate transporter permease [Roseibium sp.]